MVLIDKEIQVILKSLKMSFMIADQTKDRRKKIELGRIINKLSYGNKRI